MHVVMRNSKFRGRGELGALGPAAGDLPSMGHRRQDFLGGRPYKMVGVMSFLIETVRLN